MQGVAKYNPVHKAKCICPPPSAQVDKVPDVEANPEPGSYKVDAVQGGLEGVKRRHKLWINKNGGRRAGWRPRGRRGAGAGRFLRVVCGRFRASVGAGGLIFVLFGFWGSRFVFCM